MAISFSIGNIYSLCARPQLAIILDGSYTGAQASVLVLVIDIIVSEPKIETYLSLKISLKHIKYWFASFLHK